MTEHAPATAPHDETPLGMAPRWRSFIVQGRGPLGGRHLAGYVQAVTTDGSETVQVKFGEHEHRDPQFFVVRTGPGGHFGQPTDESPAVAAEEIRRCDFWGCPGRPKSEPMHEIESGPELHPGCENLVADSEALKANRTFQAQVTNQYMHGRILKMTLGDLPHEVVQVGEQNGIWVVRYHSEDGYIGRHENELWAEQYAAWNPVPFEPPYDQIDFIQLIGSNLAFQPNEQEGYQLVGRVIGARKSVALAVQADGIERWWLHQEGSRIVGFRYAGDWGTEELQTQNPDVVASMAGDTPYERQQESDDAAEHVTVPMPDVVDLLEETGIPHTAAVSVIEQTRALAESAAGPQASNPERIRETAEARREIEADPELMSASKQEGVDWRAVAVLRRTRIEQADAQLEHWQARAEELERGWREAAVQRDDLVQELAAKQSQLDALQAYATKQFERAQGLQEDYRKAAEQHERDAVQWREQLESTRRHGTQLQARGDEAFRQRDEAMDRATLLRSIVDGVAEQVGRLPYAQ